MHRLASTETVNAGIIAGQARLTPTKWMNMRMLDKKACLHFACRNPARGIDIWV